MEKYTNIINNAFFFVIDKIVDLQAFFLKEALLIGRVVFLIAILSAGLNYALTGTGLKENIIKILKATIFFFIVIFSYPQIISFIASWTFDLAERSIYDPVSKYFNETTEKVEDITISNAVNDRLPGTYVSHTRRTILHTIRDGEKLFNNLTVTRKYPSSAYTFVAPAEVIKIVFLIAGNCIDFADRKDNVLPEFSRVMKGLICAALLIATGCFALLEYIICFLEFMLVASVGVILFPLSIWEGSKFMAEKFIGAIVGFFIKMLFCNIAIFLMIYGFISLYYISSEGFTGSTDQIVFIVFTSLLFFYICKSAPGIAQSLLTGTPSLSATGAISAAAGAVAAAGATVGLAQRAGKAAGGAAGAVAGGVVKSGFGAVSSLVEANAASGAVRDAGGDRNAQTRAYWGSIGTDVGNTFKAGALGLTRSLLGAKGGTNPYSHNEDFRDNPQTFSHHFNRLEAEGAGRAKEYIDKQKQSNK